MAELSDREGRTDRGNIDLHEETDILVNSFVSCFYWRLILKCRKTVIDPRLDLSSATSSFSCTSPHRVVLQSVPPTMRIYNSTGMLFCSNCIGEFDGQVGGITRRRYALCFLLR